MSFDITRGYDSFIGPPSEPISVRGFLDDTASLVILSVNNVFNHPAWQGLSDDERAAIEAEWSGKYVHIHNALCRPSHRAYELGADTQDSVAALKTDVEAVWDNPLLSAHLRRMHTDAVNAVHSQAGGAASKGRKRKHLPDPETSGALPEVRSVQEKLDSISLRCWGLNQESAHFMRASKHSDFNALKHVKKSGHGALTISQPTSSESVGPSLATNLPQCPSAAPNPPPREALITLTVYNRVPWVHSQLTRFSQHAILSSQTLADLVRVIPCDSSEMPTEQVDSNGNIVGFTYDEDRDQGAAEHAEEGCLLLIEGVAYGDGRPGEDYADKLLTHLQKIPEEKRSKITKSPTSLNQTPFASLTLRINQPYWMLHQGNCDHFVVVDQIRLVHPSDPPSGYPLTLHITPALSEVCKACAKVPAVLAIVGDIRLGESPCLLCGPCWRNMGPPKGEDAEEVVVVPLVRHRGVWENGEDT